MMIISDEEMKRYSDFMDSLPPPAYPPDSCILRMPVELAELVVAYFNERGIPCEIHEQKEGPDFIIETATLNR